MKILIIGSSGLLGSKLLDKFTKKANTIGTYYSAPEKSRTYKNVVHLDITKHLVTEKFILEFRPDIIIYAASITRPDLCESTPKQSEAINYTGLKNVASICASLQIKIIYLSSDQVFGEENSLMEYSENSAHSPLNHMGKTKAHSETFLRENISNHLIIRTGLVFGFSPYTERRGLVHTIIEDLSSNNSIEVDNDLIIYPILADDIADLIFELIQRDETGVVHISNTEPYTKYSFAKEVASHYGLNSDLIKEKPTKTLQLPAKRPKGVLLKNDKIKSILGTSYKASSVTQGIKVHKRQYGCLFRMIYSVRPDMLVAGQNASEFRISVGRAIAKEAPIPNVDCVIPIPESGIYSATGVSAESGKPIFFGLIRDYFTEKTLYSPTSKDRYQSLLKKLIPIESLIKGKKIALVDEAVLSGATLGVVSTCLKRIGAKEIHVRIPSPVMSHDCHGRVLPNVELIYKSLTKKTSKQLTKSEFEELLCDKFEVDSFSFLSIDSFLNEVKTHNKISCTECFINSPHK